MPEPFNKEANDIVHAQIFALLGEIKTQTTQTNGKVRLLEKMIWLACGGLAVLTYFFGADRLILTDKDPENLSDLTEAVIDLKAEAEKLKLQTEQIQSNPL